MIRRPIIESFRDSTRLAKTFQVASPGTMPRNQPVVPGLPKILKHAVFSLTLRLDSTSEYSFQVGCGTQVRDVEILNATKVAYRRGKFQFFVCSGIVTHPRR